MKQYLKQDEWCIIEEGFKPEYNEISESVFSIGNGRMGQRANFEERYSGKSLQGNYVAGVYYPDKTRVGWWKNGYPEYFAKVLNAANWIGIDIELDGEMLDLATCKISDFRRVLNMREGYLLRTCTVTTPTGKTLKINAQRFCSIVDDEVGAICYSITPVNFSGKMVVTPYVDADVKNRDANYDEKFWIEISKLVRNSQAYLVAETKKTGFQVATGMLFQIFQGGKEENEFVATRRKRENFVSCSVPLTVKAKEEIIIYKYAANLSSENHPKENLLKNCQNVLKNAQKKGFDKMLLEQAECWKAKWAKSDIIIEGDVAAQQGIRFNIFQLTQTYTGEDERLNIGPKGFTGEKYGGSTYWDTEAYCLPFYLVNANEKVARNLLIYRHKQLQKAIENAQKLGFTDGAALYPMVTMNGEECHNEWEITFEEIHRNGAIAYAIHDYIRYTGDKTYLAEYGAEVLIGIARFWAQRVHFSAHKQQYVMHGVTGPNEYENNVNNNWYTNYIAVWCMEYAMESIQFVQKNDTESYKTLVTKTNLNASKEFAKWEHICKNMYFPEDTKRGVFLQQDGFLDKDLMPVSALRAVDKPLNQKWSWDRILRSCFIKQADVLQGLYFFEERFDNDTIRRNFEFYEPMTVHESSLSPCVHVILGAKIGLFDKAYQMYLRTSRLDLDDYNNDTEDGLHITSMAGTWMAVVKGFGGMRVYDDKVHFAPYLPEAWKSMTFKARFRGGVLEMNVTKEHVTVKNMGEKAIDLSLYGEMHLLEAHKSVVLSTQVPVTE
jgi:maltose phosphorylase